MWTVLNANRQGELKMLALHSPYVSTQFNGQPLSIINFECHHCGQRFGYDTLGMAVFLYGVFFLTRQKYPICRNHLP